MAKSPTKSERREPQLAADITAARDAPSAWLVAVVLALAIAGVYGRAVRAPFIYDDADSIEKNSSIRFVWPLIGSAEHRGPLNPTKDLPTSGRPIINLSFAINYAAGALDPLGYHLVNFTLHFLSAMLVWAIVRRTLRLPYFAGRFDQSAGWLALCVSLLWALHPVQTEAVVYVTQRTELAMAFCYLATFYCSLRFWSSIPQAAAQDSDVWPPGTDSKQRFRHGWLWLAVFVCAIGMASKEVMVSAPLVVLLFERTFISGSLKDALRRSWPLYAGLGATWGILLFLNLGGPRSDSAGYSLGVSAVQWWLTQARVLVIYLKLMVWPAPLLLHYDLPYLANFGQVWIYVVLVGLLVAVVGWLVWRNYPWGFLGVFFFAILFPTLIVPIVTEIAAERRVYLPLLAPVVLLIVGGYSLVRRAVAHPGDFKIARPVAICLVSIVSLACALVSAKRVKVYDNEIYLWQDILKVQPNDYAAHGNVGRLLLISGRIPEAIEELQLSLSLKPDSYLNLNNLGVALDHQGHYAEAIKVQSQALRINPNYVDSLQNLANSLREVGQFAAAKVQLEKAERLKPDDAEVQNNIGVLLASQNQVPKAIERFRLAAQLDPYYVPAHINLGKTLPQSGEVAEAIGELQTAIRLVPTRADLHNELGVILGQNNQNQLAIEQFQMALELDPQLARAYNNLAVSLALANRPAEAISNAQRGIEVARLAGQQDTAQAAVEWLSHYREELRQIQAKSK
jgi:tetratricopeptide (TPR) repeat protein